MNGSQVTLDTVTIEISANANSANTNINELASTLLGLKNAMKGGFNNLQNLAKGMGELKTASKGVDKVSERLASLDTITKSLQELSGISNPKGLSKAIYNLEKLPEVFSKIKPNVLENVARVSRELSSALSPLAEKLGQIAQGFSAMSSLADKYGVSVTKIREQTQRTADYTKVFNKALSSTGTLLKRAQQQSMNLINGLSKHASKLSSKIKQIGLSLLGTRTIFTATRKAVSEYMAMDAELTWKVTNNWRALGAQLAPAIENITFLFHHLIRVIYSVILALTGIDLIARANEKAMSGWGKAAKDTLGNLQKFDDLNVVEFPKDKGGGDDDKLIDLDAIDLSPIQKVIDWVRKLRDEIKEAWNSGQWEGVGEVLAEGLNGAMNAINFDKIEQGLSGVAVKFGDFLHGVVDNFDWSMFGDKLTRLLSLVPKTITKFLKEIPWENIGKGLNKALKTFDPAAIIDSILGSVNTLVLGFQTGLLQIDGSVIGQKISDGILSITGNFSDLLSKIEWGEIGTKIREVIENIDWKSIWDGVVTIFKESFNGIGDFIDGLLGTEGAGSTILGGLGIGIGISEIGKLTEIVGPAIEKVTSFGTALKLLGDGTLTTGTISGITGVSESFLSLIGSLGSSLGVIAAVVAAIVVVGVAIADLYKNNEEFRKTVDDLFASIKDTVMPIIETVINTLKMLWQDVLVPLFKLLVEIVKPFIVAIIDIISVLWQNVLQPLINVLTTILQAILPPLITTLKVVIDVLTWLWKNILEPVVSFILSIVTAAIQVLTGDIEGATETMSGAFLKIINAAKNLWEKVSGFFNKLWEGIKNVIDKIKTGWENFWDNIGTLPKRMLQGLINLINKVIGKINDKLSIKIGSKTAALLNFLGVNVEEGRYQIFSIPTIPALETGTNEIPKEGIYHLHPGEAVVPKQYNPALGGGTNEETNSRLDKLIEVMEEMSFTNVVNVGNNTLYKAQQKYNRRQNDRYGTDVAI